MSTNSVLRRFWWVLVIGVVVAVATGYVAYHAGKGSQQYTANAQLLVTSPDGPFFRISVSKATQVPTGGGGAGAATTSSRGTPTSTTPATTDAATREVIQNVPPDTATLVTAANLYPLLITSDPVTRVRNSMFGDLPGTVTSSTVFSVQTPGRFIPSSIPVVQVQAQAASGPKAIALADATAKAFIVWLKQQQNQERLSPSERILVQELSTPTTAETAGGTGLSLPVLVVVAVLFGFGVLAVILDRIVPPPTPKPMSEPDGEDGGGPDAVEEEVVPEPEAPVATPRGRPRSNRRRRRPPTAPAADEPGLDAPMTAASNGSAQHGAVAKPSGS